MPEDCSMSIGPRRFPYQTANPFAEFVIHVSDKNAWESSVYCPDRTTSSSWSKDKAVSREVVRVKKNSGETKSSKEDAPFPPHSVDTVVSRYRGWNLGYVTLYPVAYSAVRYGGRQPLLRLVSFISLFD